MGPAVSIIDFGMGNLRSVANALDAVGAQPRVVDTVADLGRPLRVVLPGVGAFGDAMRNLDHRGWRTALADLVTNPAVRLLGICLGMQVLATVGTEHGEHDGFGLLPGAVRRIGECDPKIRVPHIGWNDVDVVEPCPLFEGLGDHPTFYFLHSYAIAPEVAGVTSTCDYGGLFASSVRAGNVFGVQFHPEKSHASGLRLLRNFLSV